MIFAKKEMERYSNITNDKEYVHITEEHFKVTDISENEINDFYNAELIDDDSEENYFSYGLMTGWDGELYSIDVDKFIEGLEQYIEAEKETIDDGDGTYYLDLANKLKKSLIKYEGYELYFKDEVKE